MGWSPIRRITEAVSDVGDIVQDVVIDPVVQLGSSIEDGVREVVDEADKLIQSPEFRAVVTAINPSAGVFLDAYATVDSGEDLSPGQIAALASMGYTAGTGSTIPPDVQKAMQTGASIAEGEDPLKAVASTYGRDFEQELGLDSALSKAVFEGGLQKAMGASNTDILKTTYNRYVDEGGEFPEANISEIAANIGIDVGEFKLPDWKSAGFDLPDLPNIPGVDIKTLTAGMKPIDLGFDVGEWGQLQELGVDIGDLDLGDYNLEQLADINLDLQLPELDLALQNLGQPPSEFASLDMDSSLLPEFQLTELESIEELPLSQRLLRAQLG